MSYKTIRMENESLEDFRKRKNTYAREQYNKHQEQRRESSRKYYRWKMQDEVLKKRDRERKRNWMRLHPKVGKESTKRYIDKNKTKFFSSRGNKCEICGFLDERAFEIHHLNGDTKPRRERNVKASLKEDWITLQLLCANCHRIIHREKLNEGQNK